MANGRINIEVGLEASGVAKGAKDAEKALENLEDAVGDAAKEGKQLDKIEDELKDVQRQSDKTGRDVGKNLDDGFDKAKKGADDFKQEANSTAKEAAASFDGSAESIGDAFQEVAANAFSGFGPAGAAAGLAAAAGIGLVVAGFEAASEAAELSEERVSEWAEAYIEAGDKALTAGVLAARMQEIITKQMPEATQNAKDWGVSIETAVSAMAGNRGAIADVETSVREMGSALDLARQSGEALYDAQGNLNGQQVYQEKAYNTARDSLAKLTGEMQAGESRASILSRLNLDLINSFSGVTKEVDALGNELYTLPDETQVFVNAETGQATQNVDAFKGDVDGIPEQVTTRVKFQADTRDVDNYMSNLQRRAATGITVNLRSGQGRLWE